LPLALNNNSAALSGIILVEMQRWALSYERVIAVTSDGFLKIV